MVSKEGVYERQKLDCNCNDCYFMKRDFDAYQRSLDVHRSIQLKAFEQSKRKALVNAYNWKRKGEMKKHEVAFKEADKMLFVFDKSQISINHGNCYKKNHRVSFIPNTLQYDTQDCFEHRIDHLPKDKRDLRLA